MLQLVVVLNEDEIGNSKSTGCSMPSQINGRQKRKNFAGFLALIYGRESAHGLRIVPAIMNLTREKGGHERRHG